MMVRGTAVAQDCQGRAIHVNDIVWLNSSHQMSGKVIGIKNGKVVLKQRIQSRFSETAYTFEDKLDTFDPFSLSVAKPIIIEGEHVEQGDTLYGKSDGLEWVVQSFSNSVHPITAVNSLKGEKQLRSEWLTFEKQYTIDDVIERLRYFQRHGALAYWNKFLGGLHDDGVLRGMEGVIDDIVECVIKADKNAKCKNVK